MAFYNNMFFKVLIDPNQLRKNQPKWKKPSSLHELEIPPSFVEKNWKGLSNPILLELPTGHRIEIKWIMKKNNSVWLNEGWRRVVELLGLKHEYFVTFKYNGKSKFELIVFHPNTLEIDYSNVRNFYNDDHHQGANENHDDDDSIEIIAEEPEQFNDDDDDDDDDSIEIIAEEPEQFNNRSKEGTCKSMLKEVHENHDYIVIDDDDDEERHSKPLLMKKRTKTEGTSKSMLKKVRRNMKCGDHRRKALERAEAISSKLKNPSFVRDLRRSYVDYGILKVTKSFVKKYWKEVSNPILLELPSGDKIKVRWNKKEDDSIWLNEGWKRVVELLELKHQYFVIFKYKGESKFELIVFDLSAMEIDYLSSKSFRNDYHQGENRNHDDDDDDNQPIETVNERQEQFRRRSRAGACSERPKRVQSDSKIAPKKDNKPLRIPIEFSRKNLHGLEGKAKIGVNGNMRWDMELRFCGDRATFNAGWRNVCNDFGLKFGDVCVFEMIKDTPLFFNFFLIRPKQQPINLCHQNLPDHHQSLPQLNKVQGQTSQSRKRKRSSDGTSFRIRDRAPNMQENQFILEIKDYHLSGSTVFIPNGFCRRHKDCLGKLVNLKFGEILRPVKLLARGAFSEGWLNFAKECKLNTGDFCSFELVDDQNLIFEVSTKKSK
nr:B3 domain-containing protein REM6 [Arachis hypogaea]